MISALDTPSQPLVAGQPPWKPQLPELEPVVTSSKLAALASMSELREPRVDLPACSRGSLNKPDDVEELLMQAEFPLFICAPR